MGVHLCQMVTEDLALHLFVTWAQGSSKTFAVCGQGELCVQLAVLREFTLQIPTAFGSTSKEQQQQQEHKQNSQARQQRCLKSPAEKPYALGSSNSTERAGYPPCSPNDGLCLVEA